MHRFQINRSALALALVACRAASSPAPAAVAPSIALEDLFAYDATQPLDVKEDSVAERRGVRITELGYASPRGGRVTATLTVPVDGGRGPALLFGHWGYGNRREFLPEAELWSRAGVVCLLADYPWVRPDPWRRDQAPGVSDPELDRDVQAQAVVDLLRGLDLLTARPDVDPERVCYIGHSYGAQWGAILSAIDDRVRAAVLVAGVGRSADLFENDDPGMRAFVARTPPEALQRHIEVNSVLDAIRWVPRAAPTPLLFQFAAHEPGYSVESMERYFAAASEPKEVRWYFTGHELNDPQALLDRWEWLGSVAGLPQPQLPPGQ